MSDQEIKTYFNDITFYINFGNNESDRYRVFNIIEALLKKGIKCHLLSLVSSREEIENVLDKTDLIIVFRSEFNPKLSKILENCREKRIPTIFDIDDLLFDPEIFENKEKLLSTKYKENQEEFLSFAFKLKQTLENCDFFTGSTNTLAKAAEKYNKKAFVIKNNINCNQLKLAENLVETKNFSGKTIKIGYFSGSNTHNEDFTECEKAILGVLGRYDNVEFYIIGYLELNSEFDKYSARITRAPFMNYLEMLEYLSKIDINIAPLELNLFNDAKSELKIFEAGIMLTPTIASSTASYKNCIKDGINGFCASTGKEWTEKLTLLIEDNKLRENIARRAQKDYINEFYIDNCVSEIINTYNSIIIEYNDNAQPKELYNPEDTYRELCDSVNLKYTPEDLEQLDLLSVLYQDEDNLKGFSLIFKRYLNKPEFQKNIDVCKVKYTDKKLCLWGAGKFLELIASKLDLSCLNIVGVIDKNPQKRLSKIGDITVYNPEDLENLQPDTIIISVEKPSSIEKIVKSFLRDKNLNIDVDNIVNLLFAQN